MSKIKLGQKVKLKRPPEGKPSSSNNYIDSHKGDTFIVCNYHDQFDNKSYYINFVNGTSAGWVYEHEIVDIQIREEIIKNIEELQSEIDYLKSKLQWMDEVGTDKYDEDEFKVYETLKTLQNTDLNLLEKTKLISSLIKGNNC